MTNFWRRWLAVWCIAAGLFGAVLTGAAFPATDGPARALLAFQNPAADATMTAALRFSVALMGAVTLGWAVTIWAAIVAADRLGAQGRPVWGWLVMSVVGWFVIDSGLSIATGFALNTVSNAVLLVGFLWPVWRMGVLRDDAGLAAQRPG